MMDFNLSPFLFYLWILWNVCLLHASCIYHTLRTYITSLNCTYTTGRKVIGHEVREVQAARLLTSITEQLKQEELLRQSAENDFVEMESVLKRRVLYLEQYKAAVGGKMGRLQGRLDLSVPQEDYLVRTFTTSHSSFSSSWRKTAVTLNRDEMRWIVLGVRNTLSHTQLLLVKSVSIVGTMSLSWCDVMVELQSKRLSSLKITWLTGNARWAGEPQRGPPHRS